ncbi:hypothetical protein MLD38_030701 [Melastoma candidum]|uniref:Uncharacterized protein n=1 Tax=Melastoma candidum TaxID=119954 RepID=A0ACB9MMJ1_9MYRT|nr:hypothetical protein MLD38_030701 [Melastoma candidum]
MDFWPEFLTNSGGREFIAGGVGGIAGIVSGYPLDTLRTRLQSSGSGSAVSVLRKIVRDEGSAALFRGMGAPLAAVTFQNAMVFQVYASLSRALDTSNSSQGPPSYAGVALGGVGAGALQSFVISPVELLKVRLQLQTCGSSADRLHQNHHHHKGPLRVARTIFHREGIRGLYRGLSITMLRDSPSHGVYFFTYEYTREQLHPNCRANGDESLRTMLLSGGLAGVISWIFCYPLDVVKTRLQAQSEISGFKYNGIVDCLRKSIRDDGYGVLWHGMGAAVTRAFVVNGAIFSAYEIALRCLFHGNGNSSDKQIENAT